jgi:hypothetical protein
MKYFAGLEMKESGQPHQDLLDEFVEYAGKLDLEEEHFHFHQVQFEGVEYMAIEIQQSTKVLPPLQKIHK